MSRNSTTRLFISEVGISRGLYLMLRFFVILHTEKKRSVHEVGIIQKDECGAYA